MGIDACIFVKTSDGQDPLLCDALPPGCEIAGAANRPWIPEGATHEIEQGWRYYGPGYERGPWPLIASTLMILHASPNVEFVWYYGDTNGRDEPSTPERVNELNSHYMKEGSWGWRSSVRYEFQSPSGEKTNVAEVPTD